MVILLMPKGKPAVSLAMSLQVGMRATSMGLSSSPRLSLPRVRSGSR